MGNRVKLVLENTFYARYFQLLFLITVVSINSNQIYSASKAGLSL